MDLIHLAQLNTCRPNTTNKYIKPRYVWVVQTGTGRHHRAMTWPGGTDLGALRTGPSEPILRDEDVDVDDIPVRHHTPDHVVHLQLQDGVEWAHDGPHLAHNAHSHAVHVALDDVERVAEVPVRYVEDDVSMVGRIRRRDGPEEDDLFRAGELAEGGKRDDGVGDGVHRVQHAGDIVGAAYTGYIGPSFFLRHTLI